MKFVIILFFLTIYSTISAQDYKYLTSKALGYYFNKDYIKALESYKKAFKIEQTKGSDLVNGASIAALTNNRKLAYRWLFKALKNGYTNVRNLEADKDLISLKGTRKWNKLISKMEKALVKVEANYDKPLQLELFKIEQEDQKYRNQFPEIEKKYGYNSKERREIGKIARLQDSLNLIKIDSIIHLHGWVGPDKVGGQASQVLFLVIQHANLSDQQKYLPIMREAVKHKKARSSSLALLEDRVALDEGRRQIYGSQIGIDKETGRKFVLPLDDPDNVDKRRAEVGLIFLSDYVKFVGITWDIEEYKKQLPLIEEKLKNKQ